MADSLVLTGVKDIKKHTGTEITIARPKRGGDTHSVKEWWKGGGVSTCYAQCTVFNVTVGGDVCKLVIDSSMSTNLRIEHDGAFGFSFSGINEVKRAALFTSGYELIEHYVFPAISGGKVMTVIPAGAAAKPGGTPATSIGTVTVTGEAAPSDGATEVYTVNVSGDAGNKTYLWSATGDAALDGSATGTTASFIVATGSATISCQVTSGDAGVTDSPKSGNLSITIS